MSEVKWTTEQLQAIEEKDSNILVAAAAGSGKTAVLVERIIHKIIDEKIDIDKMLVVTFTNAAASEMRERILEAIYEKLEKEPTNAHLQKQITLLNKASICTIHSFGLDVIRNQFYELDLPSNFKIADTTEIDLLKQEVLDDLFEQKYSENNEDFITLLETYTQYRGDEPLQELILSIYRFIQSSPFPEKWIKEKIESFNVEKLEDFSETLWGKVILEEIKQELQDCLFRLENISKSLAKYEECGKFYQVINEDIIQIKDILKNTNSWDETYRSVNELKFSKWPVDKKVTLDIKDEAKEIRDKVKKIIQEKVVGLIRNSTSEVEKDFQKIYPTLQKLCNIVLEFSSQFAEKKREKNCIDFNDIEHFALKILLDENGNKTTIAKKYEDRFQEIAIDEYQDSNLVQEAILNSISKGNNIFMVGDVKQSIYKFRQARPELFLQKYENYKSKEEIEKLASNKSQKENLKIQLFRNFRSRNNILDITNIVFELIMSKNLGDIDYNETEYLNYGANYPDPEEVNKQYAGIAELAIINMKENETIMALKQETENDDSKIEESQNNDIQDEERIEDDVLEARFVANKIQELLQSGYMVYEKKKGYRPIQPKDIVILLRATSTLAPIYEKELTEIDLPVFSDSSTSYLDSVEIETILSVLKLIDNPMQDIPLVVVLRSSIGNFTDNELITIRLTDRNCNFYEALIKTRISCEEPLKSKIEELLEKLEKWRKQSEYLPLNELIWQIYLDTGYYQYVGLLPNGAMRQANLKTLFEKAKQYETASFKGLFYFIQFIEKLKKQNGDLSSAKLIGENSNVIRIMSIHKSKGLEFPVVFLCNTHKKFNLQDLNDVILLDQDLGFGPTAIDIDKKIKYSTSAKQAISLKVRQEILSEEERILYVALTRAKEKLVITGRSKDLEKALQEKEKTLSMYPEAEQFKIDSNVIRKCTSYLDWLEYVYLFCQKRDITLKGKQLNVSDVIELKTYNKQDLVKDLQKQEKQEEKTIEERIMEEVDKQKDIQDVKEILEWKYKYEIDTKLPTKTSVSKLKQEQKLKLPSLNDNTNWEDNLQELENINEENKNEISVTDKEVELPTLKSLEDKENNKLTPAQKGTLIHLCIQKIDEKKDYQIKDIEQLINELVEKEIITLAEASAIDVNLIYGYTQSKLFKELKQAKEVHKEQPFYINIPAKEVFQEAKDVDSNKNILVQGIIDLYYIDQRNEIHLIDFKTDHVISGKESEILQKYQIQLDIYRRAIEQALNKKVSTSQICLANYNYLCI